MSDTDFSTHERFFVSWEELHRDTRKLAKRLLPAEQWQGAIAITRGGLIPAAIIARELNIRLIDTICIKTYDYQERGDSKIIKQCDTDGTRMLLIDDLVDTGKTARAVKSIVPNARFVTVYAKPEGRREVDDFIKEVPQDTWINFPWDMELNYSSPLVDRED
ncbi:xanthine phosphoribosyltransferase [Chromatiales bacterium (ex Bugula neritina AB1)]|nr:xanthine phosphoribosyltransferase [Chromatiales bacterium (ex Bugula neritina AB1)]